MAYLGNTPTTQSFISGTDYFDGTGSQTAFTLTRTVNSVNDIEAVVNNVVQQPNSAYTLSGTTITFTSAPSAGTNNIYVRYLSTTTQSITPAQNTVSYSTMNTDMQGLFGQSFTNRIINGAMMIDQRNAGASISANDGKFAIDRFKFNMQTDGTGTGQQVSEAPSGFVKSIKYTATSATSVGVNDTYGILHDIEGLNVADLGWGTADAQPVTLTFRVRSSLTGTFGGVLKNSAANRCYPFTYTISSANTWETKTITVVGDTTGTWLTTNGIGIRIVFGLGNGSGASATAGSWTAGNYWSATGAVQVLATNGATWQITGVQLEKGSTATSFDYRPYGTELQLCQRYYWQNQASQAYTQFVSGMTWSSTDARFVIIPPVTMRSTPTLTSSNLGAKSSNGSLQAVTSFAIESSCGGTISVGTIANTASGLTANYPSVLQANNSTSAYIALSAEL